MELLVRTRGSDIDPSASEALVQEAARLAAAGDARAAGALAARAYTSGVRTPLVLNILAHSEEKVGRYQAAMGLLEEALQLDPHDPTVLLGIGQCLTRLGRPREALPVFDAAAMWRPDHAAAFYNKGEALQLLGEHDLAKRHYRAAIARDADYADPHAGLAAVELRDGRKDLAREEAERCLALDPDHVLATVTLAGVEIAERKYAAAEVRLRDLLLRDDVDPQERVSATILIGDALDGLDQTAQAFAAYAEGKRLAAKIWSEGDGRDRERQQEVVGRLIAAFEQAKPWPKVRRPAREQPVLSHVFLLGFPRSGTTLLEQVLAGHSEVVVLDEWGLLERPAASFLRDAAGVERLRSLKGPELEEEAFLYWRALEDAGVDVRGKVLVDKLPMNTLKLPLIVRLFPKAKILFALRDPRDVTLSCFRRDFKMNVSNAQFTNLNDAATAYDLTMRLAELYRTTFPFAEHVVRHEALVADFESETRQVCDFIGIDWEPAMMDVASTAARRTIRTPSAPQVRRGLYSDALGQWRRYERQLAPVAPILRPWVERLGYEHGTLTTGGRAS